MSDVLTCLSCSYWERVEEGPTAWRHKCRAGVVGFPNRNNKDCLAFEYEPGSDEKEMKNDNRRAH